MVVFQGFKGEPPKNAPTILASDLQYMDVTKLKPCT